MTAELEAAGALECYHGVAALILAERIDADGWCEPGTGLAAAVRELAAARDRAVAYAEARENVVPIRRCR